MVPLKIESGDVLRTAEGANATTGEFKAEHKTVVVIAGKTIQLLGACNRYAVEEESQEGTLYLHLHYRGEVAELGAKTTVDRRIIVQVWRFSYPVQ